MKQVKAKEEALIGGAGVPLHSGAWQVANSKGVVVLAHGYAEHSGRYHHVIDFLNDQGLSVYSWDWRNHGRSPGLPGYVENMDELVSDYDQLIRRAVAREPNVPLFLMGHSTGGAIALLHNIRHPELYDVTGLILSAPVVKLSVKPLLRKTSGVISRLLPKMQVVDAAPISELSRDSAIAEKAYKDPLFYKGKVRARTGYSILQGADEIQASMSNINVPILVMQGTEDKLVEAEGSDMLIGAVASDEKKLIKYDEYYHEILNEIGKEKVMQDIAEWVDLRIGTEVVNKPRGSTMRKVLSTQPEATL